MVALGPLVFLWCGGDPEEGVRDFLTLSALGYMGSYLTACLASPVLLGRIGEPSRRIMALGVVTAVILGVLLVTAFGTGVGDFQPPIVEDVRLVGGAADDMHHGL